MIRWDRVAQAIDYYQKCGYTYVEAPWIVSRAAVDVTLPQGHDPHETMDGTLVGSAEQSFIHMAQTGVLQTGRYVAATPCFRDDPVDELHQRAFFKVELIELARWAIPWPNIRLTTMIADALGFFHSLPGGKGAHIITTKNGFDIELGGIELGSYGIRDHAQWVWIYGTGYADPRFTIASARHPV